MKKKECKHCSHEVIYVIEIIGIEPTSNKKCKAKLKKERKKYRHGDASVCCKCGDLII